MDRTAYQLIIDYVLTTGARLREKTGKLADIGITKKDLTEEDLAIERGFAELISQFGQDHVLFAEEEHDVFSSADHLWVVDPISGTSNIIKGMPHYAIVATHVFKHEPIFTVVYDPSVNELFTAQKGKGAFLNDKAIHVSTNTTAPLSLNFNYFFGWKDTIQAHRIWQSLMTHNTYRNKQSFAVNYCNVACGRYDGVVALTKDTFPEFAGSLLIREAGGVFTNATGNDLFNPTDRIFIGGNPAVHSQLIKQLNPLL